MKMAPKRGFALVTVLGVVLIVSAVALALASSMRAEALQVLGDRQSLEMDQLSLAGHEMTTYMTNSRGLGSTSENLAGLPVEVVKPGFHYVIHLPEGDVDVYLDAEDGKLNLSSAPGVLLENFFSLWSGDPIRGRALAAAVKDWRDADDAEEIGGAEAASYRAESYVPRNAALGVGDAGLLRGIRAEDFRDQLEVEADGFSRRPGLSQFLTNAPVGATINPNYASELVLQAVPGLSRAVIENTLLQRKATLFRDAGDFARRTGLTEESPSWGYLSFNRRVPSVLSVARSEDGRVIRSERRVYWPVSRLNPATGGFDAVPVVGMIERNLPPSFDLP